MTNDYYEILGVTRDADLKTIKSAYRTLVKKYHPDVSKEPDAEKKFAEISQAYEVLSDENKKAKYDRFGHENYSRQSQYGSQYTNGSTQGFYGNFTQDDFRRFYEQYERTNSGPKMYQATSISDILKLLWKSFLKKSFSQKISTLLKVLIGVIILIVLLSFFITLLPYIGTFIIFIIVIRVLGALFK